MLKWPNHKRFGWNVLALPTQEKHEELILSRLSYSFQYIYTQVNTMFIS